MYKDVLFICLKIVEVSSRKTLLPTYQEVGFFTESCERCCGSLEKPEVRVAEVNLDANLSFKYRRN